MSAPRRPAPAAPPDVRAHNASLVLTEIARAGTAGAGPATPSRAQVAAATGLTRATVSTLVDELAAAGLVEEAGPAAGTGRPGRPGSPLRIAAGAPVGVGVEVDVDVVAVTALAPDGTPVWRERHPEDLHDSRPADVLGRVTALVRALPVDRPVAGVGVAIAGLVDLGGVLRRAPNLPHWVDVDVPGDLAARLQVPVRVDNDANLAALAHWDAGTRTDFAYVSGEIGVGAGVVLDGRVVRGAHGFAGEFGHVVAEPSGPVCGCGGRGCVEQYAGEAVLARAAGVTAGTAPETRARLVAAVAEGAPDAVDAVRRAGRALGVGLASLVNLVDVEDVVLGGIYAALFDELAPAVTEELARRVPGRVPALAPSPLGEDAPMHGAAITVVRRLLDDPLGRVRSGR